MKLLKLYFLFLMATALFSCQKDDDDTVKPATSDYLIFGYFYGMCQGESCVEIFQLEPDRLLEDTKDVYPNSTSFYQGKYVLLPEAKFQLAKNLQGKFPQDLLNEPDTVIGQPDAGDWGGLYLEYNQNGVRKFWLLDQHKDNVPAYLHPFIDDVNAAIAAINQ